MAHDLNDALLWLAERQGRIYFSVAPEDRIKGLEPPAPVVCVEAMDVTDEEAEDGADVQPCYGSAAITAGDVVGALIAAIKTARTL